MSIQVRKLTSADAQAYHAIRMRMLREHPEAFLIAAEEEADVAAQRERLTRTEHRDDDFIFGAFDGDTAVGTAAVFRSAPDRVKGRHHATIWGVYVAPDARKRGIGRRLVERAIDAARGTDGIEQIQLGVVPGSPARALYASLGFETWGIEKNAVRLREKYVDTEMMVLFL